MKTVDSVGKLSNINSDKLKNYSVDELNTLLNDVETLIKNGFAYETPRGIYYDISKYIRQRGSVYLDNIW